ncbi:MAG: ring-cleaving dioxygenase [Thermomicrobium sp.]|nr:ring-cleaving dioxygenase [Thermomicrobium sp.]
MTSELVLAGIHHVTAVTARAAENVRFYTQVLGLRLVKKTVNQDDVSAYHLFYADVVGSPGTEVTFFDWPHLPPHRPGHGEVARIALRVGGREALDWWAERLQGYGVLQVELGRYVDRDALYFTDFEGQRLALVDDGGVPGGLPWDRSPVPAPYQIKGLFAVTLVVRSLEPTARVLTDVLGFRLAAEALTPQRTTLFVTGACGPGSLVVVEERPDLPRAQLGAGGVHHVAFRVPDDETHRAWRERIAQAGIPVTPPIDRFYFRSLYFRELGGVLYELATDGPGFAVDEEIEHLGEKLSLPPFLEPRRAEIEANLRPLEPVTR